MTGPVLESAARALVHTAQSGDGLLRLQTSGTTAHPREVVRTLASWTASYPAFEQATGLTASDTVWVPGTSASTLSLFAAVHAQQRGLGLVATGPWRGMDEFSPSALTEVTALHAVPVVVADVLAAMAARPGLLPKLRVIITAGAAVPVRLGEQARGLGLHLVEYYGAAELSFVAFSTGSGLRAFAEVELRVDDSGTLWVRSPWLACDVAGPDGWASVGDRAQLDADGRLHLLGRPGIAQVGGTTVYLSDVEQALRTVPGVLEVVAVAVPAARIGERVAVTVLAAGEALADAGLLPALKHAAREQLPSPARPVRYRVLDHLPLTRSGKPDRAALARDGELTR